MTRTTQNGAAPVDLAAFRAEMAAAGIESVVDTAVGLFMTEAPALVEAMQEAIAAGDTEAVRKAAHKLKGSSMTIHAHALSDVAAATEDAAEAGELERAREAFERLRQAYEPARAYLHAQGFGT